jgi:sugar phosphate isomerase/epimerase
MIISLSAFLFEENQKQTVSIEKFCRIACDCGYDAVELRRSQVNPASNKFERRQILRICSDHGLTVSCLTARGLPEEPVARNDFLKSYLELCNNLNCKLLKISANAEWLSQAVDIAAEFGVCLATNNHINTELETIRGSLGFLEAVNSSNYGILYDPMHLYINGEDYIAAVDLFKDSIKNVLLHSVRASNMPDMAAIIYKGKSWTGARPEEKGVQDWKGIAEKLKQISYDGLFTVIENGWHEDMRKSIAGEYASYIKKWF